MLTKYTTSFKLIDHIRNINQRQIINTFDYNDHKAAHKTYNMLKNNNPDTTFVVFEGVASYSNMCEVARQLKSFIYQN